MKRSNGLVKSQLTKIFQQDVFNCQGIKAEPIDVLLLTVCRRQTQPMFIIEDEWFEIYHKRMIFKTKMTSYALKYDNLRCANRFDLSNFSWENLVLARQKIIFCCVTLKLETA